MWELFFTTCAISFLGSSPPGGINLILFQVSRRSWRHAYWMAGSIAFAEVLYVGIFLYSASFLAWITRHEVARASYFLFGAVLFVLAWRTWMKKTEGRMSMASHSVLRALYSGLFLGGMNIFPLFFWIGIWIYYRHEGIAISFFPFIMGVFLGAYAWFTLWIFGARVWGKHLNGAVLRGIFVLLYAGFGVYFFYKAMGG